MLELIKRDSLKVGIAVGIVLPVIFFVIATIVLKKGVGITDYLQTMLVFGSLSKVLSLCVYPNLGVFYLYLQSKREAAAKGVVWGTLAMAVVVAILYFIQKTY